MPSLCVEMHNCISFGRLACCEALKMCRHTSRLYWQPSCYEMQTCNLSSVPCDAYLWTEFFEVTGSRFFLLSRSTPLNNFRRATLLSQQPAKPDVTLKGNYWHKTRQKHAFEHECRERISYCLQYSLLPIEAPKSHKVGLLRGRYSRSNVDNKS